MRVVFHHPLPVVAGATAASGIRPLRMLEALRALGFEVDVVAGDSSERARAIAGIDARLREGQRYAFAYAESSTEPTLLTDRHHLPLHPWLDFGLLARLRRHGTPIGLFYRDVYWRFPGYGLALPAWKRAGAKLCYRYDLWQYARIVNRLYLPSMAMARHVPWVDRDRLGELPPGCTDRVPPRRPAARLRLLYVGGLGEHYRMHALLRALDSRPEVELVICTRAAEWQAKRHEYPLPAAGNVRIEHRSGEQLAELFEHADIGVVCVEPQPYWEFAAPLKLYEYLGAERPVIASEGTLAAQFATSQGIGWSVPYDASQIAGLLGRLAADRSLLDDKILAARRVKPRHSWQARARQVAADLAGLS